MNYVTEIEKSATPIITELTKEQLVDIINRCEAPVCLIADIAKSVDSVHGRNFITQSCNIVEDLLTLSEEIIKRLPGESERSASNYTKHIDDCLLNVITF